MRKRDLEILKSLEIYKCLTRSQIATLHFSTNANPTVTSNRVLKRLRQNDYIQANTDRAFHEYIYFLNPSPIKINSQKLDHYLLINQTIIDMQSYSPIKNFQIESSIPDAEFIPDIYIEGWLDKNWFIECQNSLYTTKQLYTKLDRFEKYYDSGYYEELVGEGKPFPNVLIIGETNLKFNDKEYPFIVRQVKSVHDLKQNILALKEKVSAYKSNGGGIKFVVK